MRIGRRCITSPRAAPREPGRLFLSANVCSPFVKPPFQFTIGSATTLLISRDSEFPWRRMRAMSRSSHDWSWDGSDLRHLGPFERWTTDEGGEPIVEWDTEAHARWLEKWAPACLDGSAQRLRHALGFRERNRCELELRVPLGGDDGGVCDVLVDERDDELYVRVLVWYREDDQQLSRDREYMDCPVRTWLEQPLGERAVIDVDSDEELPLYTSRYLNNVIQPDHGYRPVNRRRRSQ